MPLPAKIVGGYRGVAITTTKLGFVVVAMSHNRHRFGTTDEAKRFIDDVIKRERGE